MKIARIAATIVIPAVLALGAARAEAREIQTPVSRHLYICATGGLSRVAARIEDAAQPAPCCEGQLACPQLLANTGLVKPRRPNRT